MSFPAGTDLANRAVEHDENCEWQLAIELYVRAADVIEYAFNSGQPLPPLPPGHDYPDLVAQYRNRASEIAQDYPQGIGGQPGNNSSAAASTSAAARSMFQKFKSTASKAASKTKETAISAGQTAKSAASSAYAAGTTAVNTKGTFANKVAGSAAHGLGGGFGWRVGANAGQAVSNVLFPAPLRRR